MTDTPNPDGIPEDVWDSAWQAYWGSNATNMTMPSVLANTRLERIAGAILAERERCAQVAQLWSPPSQPMTETTNLYRAFEVSDAIAAAIRWGGQ